MPASADGQPAANPAILALASALAGLNFKFDQVDSELEAREPLHLVIRERPEGTAGRGKFQLQSALGLDDYPYKMLLVCTPPFRCSRSIAYGIS